MSTVVGRDSIVFAGLPGSSWALAIRIWLAIVLALHISFWLELEAPSSAAVTVTILTLPTRGQVLEKAVFRLIATVIGVAASSTIVGLFSQTGTALLVAFVAAISPADAWHLPLLRVIDTVAGVGIGVGSKWAASLLYVGMIGQPPR